MAKWEKTYKQDMEKVEIIDMDDKMEEFKDK